MNWILRLPLKKNNEQKYKCVFVHTNDIIDRVMIILRDGKKLIGYLRSYDQFVNMVLEDTVERIVVEQNFGDYPLGLYMVRGENVVLMAEVDETLEHELETKKILNRVSLPEILQQQKEFREAQQPNENAFDI
jgi:U6 snRNA-associated Sm-like protein LSm1